MVNYTRLAGTMTLGTVPLDVSAQVIGVILGSETETGDAITVLSGDQITSGMATSSTLSGTFVLDPYAAGVGEWTWTNHGTEQPFELTVTAGASTGVVVTGTVFVTRLSIGGEAYGDVLQSEFEWAVVGEPSVVWPTGPAAARDTESAA